MADTIPCPSCGGDRASDRGTPCPSCGEQPEPYRDPSRDAAPGPDVRGGNIPPPGVGGIWQVNDHVQSIPIDKDGTRIYIEEETVGGTRFFIWWDKAGDRHRTKDFPDPSVVLPVDGEPDPEWEFPEHWREKEPEGPATDTSAGEDSGLTPLPREDEPPISVLPGEVPGSQQDAGHRFGWKAQGTERPSTGPDDPAMELIERMIHEGPPAPPTPEPETIPVGLVERGSFAEVAPAETEIAPIDYRTGDEPTSTRPTRSRPVGLIGVVVAVVAVFVGALLLFGGSLGGNVAVGPTANPTARTAPTTLASAPASVVEVPDASSAAPSPSSPSASSSVAYVSRPSSAGGGTTSPCTTVITLHFVVTDPAGKHAGETAFVNVTGQGAGSYRANVNPDGTLDIPLPPLPCAEVTKSTGIIVSIGGRPAVAEGATTPSGGTQVDLCQRLTEAAAASILGTGVTIDRHPFFCVISPAGGSATVNGVKYVKVTLFDAPNGGDLAYAAAEVQASAQGGIKPVKGVGDKAFFGPTGLNVLAGSHYLLLGSQALFDPQKLGADAPEPVLVKFAEAVLAGL